MASDLAREKEQLRRMRLRNKGGLTLRASGVHVHCDIGDESSDVDIATTDGASVSLPSAESFQPAHSLRFVTRSQRPPPTARTHTTTTKSKIRSEPDKCTLIPAKSEKPKSETHKQAWSISEQHLLERLLTEIPDGENNRYATQLFVRARIYIPKMFNLGGPRYRRLWVADVIRVRSQAVHKVF